jgi:hypothetical protein
MTREGIARELLKFVARLDGQWYWVAVDPWSRPHRVPGNAMFEVIVRQVMEELVGQGLIESRPNLSLGPPDRYWLTDDGRRAIGNADVA